MSRQLGSLVFSVMNTVENQLAGVVAVEPVIDDVALAAGLNEPCQSKLGEVLRDGWGRFADSVGKFAYGEFAIEQAPQQHQPSAV